MAYYTTEEEITVNAEIELEITVQDQDGNDIECDIDGHGFSITAQIDTESIKENMMDEFRDTFRDEFKDELREELKEELRDELKEELREEFKAELYQEIATADSPINALSGMLSLIAIEHDKVNNVMNESIAKSNTRMHEQSEEILTLKDSITSLGATIDSQNEKGERLCRIIEKQQVRLDEGSEARIEALQTLEEAREEASAVSGPLSIIAEHNANSQETK